MKKIIIATAIFLGIAASAGAAQTAISEMDMSQHQQAVIAHNTMNNGNSYAHQQMADMHRKMMGEKAKDINTPQSFSAMNEHQQAMTVHENMNNGNSYAHQKMADAHKNMMGTQSPAKTAITAKSCSSMNEHEQIEK